ncbi:MBL fold metallo-hydrolase [Roseibium sp. RKSG952]|uniref:MBL fold metallo-hydrolase n=1 Tax=Roseibium sp. RKSG952 TaxID=2529384 RepID=UPI0018AD2BDA|nr:MBL fold metallo-hydrolase [Roseibium sp. RKSG952]
MSRLTVSALAFCAGLFAITGASAEECLKVTLTGTQGGPPVFQGQAGAGTLVQYGSAENQCKDVQLQFDTGRGTTQRLSQAGVPVGQLDAIFITHLHSDHTEGLGDMMQLRWHFNSRGPKVDLVCSEETRSPLGFALSCERFAAHIGDALIKSGEMAQRLAENNKRLPGGPADLIEVRDFKPSDDIAEVWSKGDVRVSAIRSTHIPGHASYRVDTPAGSVVIGGDAGNDVRTPPRATSTSDQVETLSQGADILVHSTIHPVMGPDGGTGFPPPIYFRQSNASDLGSLATRAGVKKLMLTHLIPPVGAARQGPYKLPDGALSENDYLDAVSASGFEGETVVGSDLASLTLSRTE